MFDRLLSVFEKSGFAAVSKVGNDYKVSAGSKSLTVSAKGSNISVVNDSAKSEIVLPAKYNMLVLSAISRAISSVGVKKWAKSVSKVMAKFVNSKPASAAVIVPVACSKDMVIFKDVLSRHFIVRMPALQAIARWNMLRARSADYLMLEDAELFTGEPGVLESEIKGFESNADMLADEIKDEMVDFDRIEITVGIDPDADEGQQIADIVINTPYSDVGDTAVLALSPDGDIDLGHLTEVDELGSEEVFEAFSKRVIPSRFAVAYSAHALSFIYTLMGSKKAEACAKVFRSAVASLKTGSNMVPAVASIKVAPFPKLTVSNKRGIYRFAISEEEVMVEDGAEVVDEFEEAVEDVAVEDIVVDAEAVADALTELVEVLELPAEVVEEIKVEVSEEEPSEWVDVADGEEADIEIGEAEAEEEFVAESRRLAKVLLALSKDSKIRKSVISRLKTLKALRSAKSSISLSVAGGKLIMALSEVQSTDSETGTAVIAEEAEKVLKDAKIEIPKEVMEGEEEKVESSKSFPRFVKCLMAMKAVSSNMRKYKAEPLLHKSSKSAISYAIADSNNYVKVSALSGKYALEVINGAKVARSSVKESIALMLMAPNTVISRFALSAADIDSNVSLSRVVSGLSFTALSSGISQDRMLKSFESNMAELNAAVSSAKEVVGSSLRPIEARRIASNGKYAFSFLYRGKTILLGAERAASGKLVFSFRSDVRDMLALSRMGAELVGKAILKSALNRAQVVAKKQRAASADMPASAPVNAPIGFDFLDKPFSLDTFNDPRAAIYALSEVTVDIDSEAAELFAHLDDESLGEKDILIKLEDKEEEFFESEAETINDMGETMLDVVESRKFLKAASFLKAKGVKSSKVTAVVKSAVSKKERIKRGRMTMQRLGMSTQRHQKARSFASPKNSYEIMGLAYPFDLLSEFNVGWVLNLHDISDNPDEKDILSVIYDDIVSGELDGYRGASSSNRVTLLDFDAPYYPDSEWSINGGWYEMEFLAKLLSKYFGKTINDIAGKGNIVLPVKGQGGITFETSLVFSNLPTEDVLFDYENEEDSYEVSQRRQNARNRAGRKFAKSFFYENMPLSFNLGEGKSGVLTISGRYFNQRPSTLLEVLSNSFERSSDLLDVLDDVVFHLRPDLVYNDLDISKGNSFAEAWSDGNFIASVRLGSGGASQRRATRISSVRPTSKKAFQNKLALSTSSKRPARSAYGREASIGFSLIQSDEFVIEENYREDHDGAEPPAGFWDDVAKAELKEWEWFKQMVKSKVPTAVSQEFGHDEFGLSVSVEYDPEYAEEMAAFIKSLGSVLDENVDSYNATMTMYELGTGTDLVGDESYGALDRIEVFIDVSPENNSTITALDLEVPATQRRQKAKNSIRGRGKAAQRFAVSMRKRMARSYNTPEEDGWELFIHDLPLESALDGGDYVYDYETGEDIEPGDPRYDEVLSAHIDSLVAYGEDRAKYVEEKFPGVSVFFRPGGDMTTPSWDITGKTVDLLKKVIDFLSPYDERKGNAASLTFLSDDFSGNGTVDCELFLGSRIEDDKNYKELVSKYSAVTSQRRRKDSQHFGSKAQVNQSDNGAGSWSVAFKFIPERLQDEAEAVSQKIMGAFPSLKTKYGSSFLWVYGRGAVLFDEFLEWCNVSDLNPSRGGGIIAYTSGVFSMPALIEASMVGDGGRKSSKYFSSVRSSGDVPGRPEGNSYRRFRGLR